MITLRFYLRLLPFKPAYLQECKTVKITITLLAPPPPPPPPPIRVSVFHIKQICLSSTFQTFKKCRYTRSLTSCLNTSQVLSQPQVHSINQGHLINLKQSIRIQTLITIQPSEPLHLWVTLGTFMVKSDQSLKCNTFFLRKINRIHFV